MKKSFFLICFVSLLFSNFIMAQHSNYHRIADNNYTNIKIEYITDVQNLQVTKIETEQGYYSQISYEGMTPMQEAGQPALPIITNLLEIPLCEGMEVNVVSSTYEVYNLAELGIIYPIMPTQPSHPKSEDGPFPFVINEATYANNSFYGMPLAQAEKAGILRNICLGRLTIAPFEYNPVTNELRVCTHLDVEVSFVNANIPQTMEMKAKHGNGLFDGQHCGVINPMNTPGFRDEIDNAPIKYLIVAHSMFRNNENLTSFINWKKRIGYLVEIAYTDDTNVGTTTNSIRNFIKAKYDNATAENPAPTFLLIVGDKEQIPAFTGVSETDHITDLYYATWTTGDNIPDCYYGRFSAQTVSQLTPQIDKTLMYEQYTMPDPSYLDDAVLVAGTDANYGPTHANGQINYAANNYVNTANGYTTVHTHLYNCSSQAATIRAEIGAGVGWANYTAHCSYQGWADPTFENNHVNSMSNADKYGFMVGNCCESGRFEQTCFGETLLRATRKGAVIYLGASNSTYWDEDYYWAVGLRSSITANPTYAASNLGFYDRLFHTHNEAHSQWYVTAGGINMAGNLAVESSSSSRKLYYWEIYHVFGDPSLKPYMSEPSVMNLSIPSNSSIALSSLDITAVPYAYVVLTQNNELIAATFADGTGAASLTLPAGMIPGDYELAISAQNYVQYFQTINFASPDAFYAISSVELNNSSSSIHNNEDNNWNLSISNASQISGNDVWVKVIPVTPNIYFSVDSVYIGSMAGGQEINLSNAFTSRTIASLNNNELISLRLVTYSSVDSFVRNYNFYAAAPALTVTRVNVLNSNNTLGGINPGESGTISFVVSNLGANDINNLTATLVSHHNDVTVNTGSTSVAQITANGTVTVNFNVSLAAQANVNGSYPLLFTINNEEYMVNMPYSLSYYKEMEDFESGDFSAFNWTQGNNPWEITQSDVYEGTYCARSKTGLSNSSSSELSITLNVSQAGTISYYRKISSETNWDKFTFSIDGSVKETLSGDQDWEQVSFNVSAGNHTFLFKYTKDQSVSSGSDCAWIDNIVLPIPRQNMNPTSPLLTIDHYDIEGSYAGNIILGNEEPTIKVMFKNEGSTAASNIEATLSTESNGVNINNNSGSDMISYASMAVNSSKTASYDISFVNGMPEIQNILFNFTLSCGGTSTSCPILLTSINIYDPSSINGHHVSSLLVYPNPSSDYINIQSNTVINEIEVIDMTGRCVRHAINVNSNTYSLNVSSLSSAIYFVRVKDENKQTLISKIIKK